MQRQTLKAQELQNRLVEGRIKMNDLACQVTEAGPEDMAERFATVFESLRENGHED
jgi:hypothetical protein